MATDPPQKLTTQEPGTPSPQADGKNFLAKKYLTLDSHPGHELVTFVPSIGDPG